MGVKKNLIVALIFILLMVSVVEHIFTRVQCDHWLFVDLLWRNVYPSPFIVFEQGCFAFVELQGFSTYSG